MTGDRSHGVSGLAAGDHDIKVFSLFLEPIIMVQQWDFRVKKVLKKNTGGCRFLFHASVDIFLFFLYAVDVLTPKVAVETINKAAKAICTPPVDLWMQMQRKRRRGDFNELHTLYIYRGRMTDGVIFQFNSPSSIMCNSDAKG